jgi:hypothetical protein
MNRRDLRGAAVLVRTELLARVRDVRSDARRALATLLTLVALPLWIGVILVRARAIVRPCARERDDSLEAELPVRVSIHWVLRRRSPTTT